MALVLLAVAAVVAYNLVYAERIYPGVTYADGLALGSLTRQEASNTLARRYGDYLKREVRLRYRDQEWLIPADALGLRLEVDGVVDAAYLVGRQGDVLQRLSDQLAAVRQGHLVNRPVLVVDEVHATAYFEKLAKEIDRPAITARLLVDGDLRASISPSQVGRKVSTERAVLLVLVAFTTGLSERIDLPVDESPPVVVEADLEAAKTKVSRMLSAPLTLRFGDRSWTLSARDIANLLVPDDGVRSMPGKQAKLDDDGLHKFVRRLAGEIDQGPQKPRLHYDSGQLRIVREGKPGYRLDVQATVDGVKAGVLADDRTVLLPVQVTLPAGMSEDRRAIKELVSSASTNYAGGLAERRHNVELAASKLNGVVVGPGETFSFNEELGPMTLQAGFQWGWGISQSQGQIVTVPSVAGGICQVSTTLFQSVFWAGYQIEERNWHLYWIDRYGQPPTGLKGLDATVDQVYDKNGKLSYAVDLKFQNTTPYPILIEAKADGAWLTFNLYGTKPNWKVTVDGPRIEDVVKADPAIVREVDPTLPSGRQIWTEAAQDGFKSTIVRTVAEPGKEPRSLRLVSTYKPSRTVVRVASP